jgi:hypothetical protein
MIESRDRPPVSVVSGHEEPERSGAQAGSVRALGQITPYQYRHAYDGSGLGWKLSKSNAFAA